MEQFIARQNVDHFRHLIEQETDPVQRQRLERMLAEEEAKLLGSQPSAKTGDDASTSSRPDR